MPPSTQASAIRTRPDEDLTDQARSGHGVPSQDPNPAAQFALDPREAEREGHSVLMAGAMVAGMVAGAAIGVSVAGPVGVVVGAPMGAVAVALGGAAAGGVGRSLDPEGASGAGSAGGPLPASAVRLHIDDTQGSGRAVVLIHGWPLSAQAWALQTAVLQAAGHRVVAYDRRGFGRSDKPPSGYGYDELADDLERVMDQCGLQDVTLVGFSMGGGEVARYIGRHGQSRLRSVVFAAAVTPCLMNGDDNPEGPLTAETAQAKTQALERDRNAYFDEFITAFFSAHGVLQVTEVQRGEAIALCHQSAQHAALACMASFSTTDFREDLMKISVPTLVIHGDQDAIVPIEGSGLRTHRAVRHSQLVRVGGAPHGLNVSHPQVFNEALLSFLRT